MMNIGRIIKVGTNCDCKHENLREAGHGTVTFFMECTECGAMISYFTGHDEHLAARESSMEPPYE